MSISKEKLYRLAPFAFVGSLLTIGAVALLRQKLGLDTDDSFSPRSPMPSPISPIPTPEQLQSQSIERSLDHYHPDVLQWQDKSNYWADVLQLPRRHLLTLIQLESSGNPNAKNPNTADVNDSQSLGLCGVIFKYHKNRLEPESMPEDLLDPDTNLLVAGAYMYEIIKDFPDDIPAQFAHYHGGIGAAVWMSDYGNKSPEVYNQDRAEYINYLKSWGWSTERSEAKAESVELYVKRALYYIDPSNNANPDFH